MELTENVTTVERKLMNDAVKRHIPINGSMELLPLCNMNCDMCYVRLSKEEVDKQGRIRSAEEWLEIGSQMAEAGTMFLLLTGGEPLLHPQFKEIYLGLKKLGMILTINTNGTLINEEWAEFFGKNKPRRINITLYGPDRETYENLCHYGNGFDRVIKGIQLLREHDVDVKIGGSLTRANKEKIDQLIGLGEKLDAPVRVDTYMMPAKRERTRDFDDQSRVTPKEAAKERMKLLRMEMGEELFQQYRKQILEEIKQTSNAEEKQLPMTCMAGNCSFTINWQGEMRPCVIMKEPAMSLSDHTFQQARQYIQTQTSKILLNSKCSTCKYKPLCRTCAASALLETGSYQGIPKYMCEYAEESYNQLLNMEETQTQL